MEYFESEKIVDMLDATYSILDKDEKANNVLKKVWHKTLVFYDYKDVGIACGNYIANNRVKPKPSDIKSNLDVMQAKRHSAYEQIEYNQKLDCESKLTRQNLLDIFNQEFAPFLKMNLPKHLKEELREKHNQKNIDDFVAKVWGYVMGSDFQVFHIESALGELRGTKFTFERFMKALVNVRDFSDNFYENKEENITKVKKYLVDIVKNSQDSYKYAHK